MFCRPSPVAFPPAPRSPIDSGRACFVLAWLVAAGLLAGSWEAPLRAQGVYVRGDCDQSLRVDISDPITLLSWLFLGRDEPICRDACDFDDGGSLDITDAIYGLSYLFLGGPPPPPPFPHESIDPSEDALPCANGRAPIVELHFVPARMVLRSRGEVGWARLRGSFDGEEEEDVPLDSLAFLGLDDPAIAELDLSGRIVALAPGRTRARARLHEAEAVLELEVDEAAGAGVAPRFDWPPSGTVVAGARIEVRASLAGALENVEEVEVIAPSGNLAEVSRSGRIVRASVALEPGENEISIRVRAAGRVATDVLRVRRVAAGEAGATGPDGRPFPRVPEPLVDPPDETPPRVAIDAPLAGATFLTARIDVEGSVDDPRAEVRVAGRRARVEGGRFRIEGLLVPPGDARIVAEATDPVGNVGRAEVAVRVVAEVPSLELISPTGAPYLVVAAGAEAVRIAGRVDPPGSFVTVDGVPATVSGAGFSIDVAPPADWRDLVIVGTWPGRPEARRGLVRTLVAARQSAAGAGASAKAPAPIAASEEPAAAGGVADTAVVGRVEDDLGRPVAGARVALAEVEGSEALTDAAGAFALSGIPSGEILLRVGATSASGEASRRARIATGETHRLDRPLRVSRRADGPRARSIPVAPELDTLITLTSLPGFRLHIPPGGAIFPGGSDRGVVTVAHPNRARLGSPLPAGRAAEVVFEIGPPGLRFGPDARLELPVDALGPGRAVALWREMESAGRWLEVARAEADPGGLTATFPSPPGAGLYFVEASEPLAAPGGSVRGRVEAMLPRLAEVPERAASAVVARDVLAHSGEFFLEAVDLAIPGRGIDWRLRRRYESRHLFRGSLGWNWEHEYADRRLEPGLGAGNVVRADGAGSFDEYLLDAATGSYVSPLGVFTRLSAEADGHLVERDGAGTRYRYLPLDGSPSAGRLESITDRCGNRLRMERDGDGLLAAVIDTLGRRIEYRHDGEGRIAEVTGPTGRSVRFEYDERGDLVAVTGPAIVATPNHNDFPQGRRTEYEYLEGEADARLAHDLVAVIDPREVAAGTRVPRLVNHYGEEPGGIDFDRVVAQEVGGTNETGVAAGGRWTIEYEAGGGVRAGRVLEGADRIAYLLSETTVTRVSDPEGVVTEIRSSGAGLPLSRRIFTREGGGAREPRSLRPPAGVAPPWYRTRWQWSADGQLEWIEEPGGVRTEYEYDAGSPFRWTRAEWIVRRRFPAPAAGGSLAAAEVTRRKVDPLFGRVLWTEPPAADAASAEARATTRFLDYQEGVDVETLAARAGVAPGDLAAALERAGIELALGDLNGDGVTTGAQGSIVREELPAVARSDGSREEAVRTFVYNPFGQLVRRRDATGTETRFEYWPERDPEGDGEVTPGDRLDPATGGLPRRVIVDPPGRTGQGLAITTSVSYDRWGNPARIVDPDGHETFLSHNAAGELVEWRIAPPLRYRRWYDRDAGGDVVAVHVENFRASDEDLHLPVVGNPWIDARLERDLLGRVVSITREVSGGDVGPERSITRRFGRDGLGRPTRIAGATPGRDETFEYDERGLLVAWTRGAGSPEAATRSWARNAAGEVVLATGAADRDGDGEREATEFRRDGFGRRVATIDPAGNARVLERAPGGEVLSQAWLERLSGGEGGAGEVAPGGAAYRLLGRTELERDERGRLAGVKRWLFGEGEVPRALRERIEYDEEGRVARRERPGGRVERFERDAAGRVVVHERADGTRVEREWSAAGDLLEERTVDLSEEPLGPAGGDDPDFDEEGRLRRVERFVHVWDSRHRRIATIDDEGDTWRVRYDSLDRVIMISDANGPGRPPAADRDLAGVVDRLSERQIAGINDHGNRVRYDWDGAGRLVAARYELRAGGDGGAPLDTENPFDLDGVLTVGFEWDDDGRLVARVEDGGGRTEYEYDAAGWPTLRRWPDGTEERRQVDRDGDPVSISRPGGVRVRQEFDALGRLLQRVITAPPEAGIEGTAEQRFAWDGRSRLVLAADGGDPIDPVDDVIVERRYDSLGRLVEELQDGFAFRYERDGAGRAIAVRYPDGRRIERARFEHGSLAAILDEGLARVRYQRFASGRLIWEQHAGGLRLDYLEADGDGIVRLGGYDARGAITRQQWTDAAGELRLGFEYGRDREGFPLYERRLHERGEPGDVWRYDSIYRVRLWIPDAFDPRFPEPDPVRKARFVIDGSHDWRFLELDQGVRSIEVDARHRYTAIGDEELEWDERGNLREVGGLELRYDGLDRLVRVLKDGETVARYRYDALGAEDPRPVGPRGRRVSSEVLRLPRGRPAGLVRSTYLEEGLAEERAADGALLRQYVLAGPRRPVLLRVLSAGVTPSADSPPARYSFLLDGRGSTAALADETGAIVERAAYGLHGEPVFLSSAGNPIPAPRTGNALWFGGLRHDLETGFHALGARSFHPALGRWTSEEGSFFPLDPLAVNPYLTPGLPARPGEVGGAGSVVRARDPFASLRLRLRFAPEAVGLEPPRPECRAAVPWLPEAGSSGPGAGGTP